MSLKPDPATDGTRDPALRDCPGAWGAPRQRGAHASNQLEPQGGDLSQPRPTAWVEPPPPFQPLSPERATH